jgi:hypothetical protein
VGIYKFLADTSMWNLVLRPRSFLFWEHINRIFFAVCAGLYYLYGGAGASTEYVLERHLMIPVRRGAICTVPTLLSMRLHCILTRIE